MKMLDLYNILNDPDTPWFDVVARYVHSHKNVERMFLERELNGVTHLYLIHGYQADGHIITWYELRNKITKEKIGPNSHYSLIEANDLEAHLEYCRLLLDTTVFSADINLDDVDLAMVATVGNA